MTWSNINKLKAGKCAHKVFATVTAMRSLGIPVAVDFTPNWANFSLGHMWCSLIMPDGKIYPFDAASKTKVITQGEAPHKKDTFRKYAIPSNLHKTLERMIGGVFQGANKSDFSDAENLFSIQKAPVPNLQRIYMPTAKKFRYVRFFHPANVCRLNEWYLYGGGSYKKSSLLNGKLISAPNIKDAGPTLVLDGNMTTGFTALEDRGGWIGYDFEKQVKLTYIDFCPPTDGNGIKVHDEYELYYWNGKWQAVGIQKAVYTHITFDNVPVNSLLLLHDCTAGKEERIFTYENGLQIWW